MAENDSDTTERSPKQLSFIHEMVAGKTITQAIANTGIGQRTAYRWLKDPQFQSALNAAKDSIFYEKLDILRNGISTTLSTLLRNMKEDVPPAVQVRAAQIWLEHSIQMHSIANLQERMQALEERLKEQSR